MIFSKKAGLACSSLIIVAGCATTPGPAVETSHIAEDMIYTRTASAASTFVHAPGSDYFICNHPAPDAAYDQADGGSLSVSIISTGSSESATSEESADEVELSGRTPVLLMSRELLFRNCEFAHNYKLTKDEAVALHQSTLNMIGKVWVIEAGNTTITNADALTINDGETISSDNEDGDKSSDTAAPSDSDAATFTTSDDY